MSAETEAMEISAIQDRAAARSLRRLALQAGGHASARMMSKALGLSQRADRTMKSVAFRLAYSVPDRAAK